MIELNDLEIISQAQEIYDNFNGFILSPDTKVFGKLLARTLLFNSVKNIPGDILELGVFKGTGIMTFLKLKRYLTPNSGKKVIGFDFFDTESLLNSLTDQEKEAMTCLFKQRGFSHEESFKKHLHDLIKQAGFCDHEFDLVNGDASQTVKKYINTRPGLKISLLYLDLDLEEPTYNVLQAAWDRVSSGGIVVFDEYAFHKWSESKGVDRFFEDKDVQIRSLNFIAPSAYVVKK